MCHGSACSAPQLWTTSRDAVCCRFDSNPTPQVAAVSIYYDGSILVTHGGLEVGQGLTTKVKQVRRAELSFPDTPIADS